MVLNSYVKCEAVGGRRERLYIEILFDAIAWYVLLNMRYVTRVVSCI